MTDAPLGKALPRLLSHSAHEVRNSLSVALGYTGFVLRDKKAQISEQHREWLGIAQRACGRLTDLANEMSDLAKLESGEVALVRTATDLRAILAGAIAALPTADREIDVELSPGDGPVIVNGDPAKLKKALTSILCALRLQAVQSTRLVVEERSGDYGGRRVSWIVAGDAGQLDALRHAANDSLEPFDRSVGNTGISLWIAGWVLDAHGGAIWSLGDATKGAAIIMLPHQPEEAAEPRDRARPHPST